MTSAASFATPQRRVRVQPAAVQRDPEWAFQWWLFGLAVGLRALIWSTISLLQLTMFDGDNIHYEFLGWGLAQVWNGTASPSEFRLAHDFNSGMYFWVGVIYWLVGARWILLPLFVNWCVGALNAVLIYRLGALLFTPSIGRRASVLVAVLPSWSFWTALLYKEAVVFLFTALALYALLLIQRRMSLSGMTVIVVCVLALMQFRGYLAYLMAGTVVATLGLSSGAYARLSFGRRFTLLLLLTVLFTAVGGMGRAQQQLQSQLNLNILERIEVSRADLAQSAASGILSRGDVSTPAGALLYLPKGMAFLLLTPAPWQFGALRQSIAIPETLLWYVMIPFTLIGMAHGLRHRRGAVFPILLFTGAQTLFYALLIGNIGTAVRERAQMLAFWFIFAAAGWELRRGTLALDPQPVTRSV